MSVDPTIRRIAAAYPSEAANVPGWERQRYFTDEQQAAWAWRFHQIEPAELAQMQASGVTI